MATTRRSGGTPGNRGNRRTGVSRARQGSRPGPIPWNEDPLILSRLQVVWRLMVEGHGPSSSLPTLNAWLEKQSLPAIGLGQLNVDRRHVVELARTDIENAIDEHRIRLLGTLREMWRTWHNKEESATVRMRLPDAILRIEEDLMKLSGAGREMPLVQQAIFVQSPSPEVFASDEYNRAVDIILDAIPNHGTGGTGETVAGRLASGKQFDAVDATQAPKVTRSKAKAGGGG